MLGQEKREMGVYSTSGLEVDRAMMLRVVDENKYSIIRYRKERYSIQDTHSIVRVQ